MLLAATFTISTPAIWLRIGRLVGYPNVSALLSQGSVIMFTATPGAAALAEVPGRRVGEDPAAFPHPRRDPGCDDDLVPAGPAGTGESRRFRGKHCGATLVRCVPAAVHRRLRGDAGRGDPAVHAIRENLRPSLPRTRIDVEAEVRAEPMRGRRQLDRWCTCDSAASRDSARGKCMVAA